LQRFGISEQSFHSQSRFILPFAFGLPLIGFCLSRDSCITKSHPPVPFSQCTSLLCPVFIVFRFSISSTLSMQVFLSDGPAQDQVIRTRATACAPTCPHFSSQLLPHFVRLTRESSRLVVCRFSLIYNGCGDIKCEPDCGRGDCNQCKYAELSTISGHST
jgi:hypothetical protein